MKHTFPLFIEGHGSKRTGFTLVEVLVVVAVSAMLSMIVIAYSNVSKNEISVSVEAAKISQTVFQAKTLAIATYATSASSCGYGVSFDYAARTYSIFTYNPSIAPPCPTAASVAKNMALGGVSPREMRKYTDATWNMPVARGVLLQENPNGQNDSVKFILFYPPDPTTFISHDGNIFTDASQPSSNIYLAPAGNASTMKIISINSAGQITY